MREDDAGVCGDGRGEGADEGEDVPERHVLQVEELRRIHTVRSAGDGQSGDSTLVFLLCLSIPTIPLVNFYRASPRRPPPRPSTTRTEEVSRERVCAMRPRLAQPPIHHRPHPQPLRRLSHPAPFVRTTTGIHGGAVRGRDERDADVYDSALERKLLQDERLRRILATV